MSSPARPALFHALPWLEGRIPFVPLGVFPTPVERVTGLLPPSVELWVKRDDRSGAAYGGNKVRKLEFLLAEAHARGARRLLTVGGTGSHHVLATAIYGAAQGFPVEAVVFPQPASAHVRTQLLADVAAGARLRPVPHVAGVPFALALRRLVPETCYVTGGGSSPTGTLGYVSAAIELSAQTPPFDAIYLALGSCGTAAGLLAGLRSPRPLELVGVRVVERLLSGEGPTRRLAARALARLAAASGPRPVEPALGPGVPPTLRVEHRFFGGAYGRATTEAEAAVARAGGVGLVLEPTYTGKAMAALLDDAAAGRLDGKRVLFWHTFSSADLAPLLARGPGPRGLPPALRGLVGP